MYQNLLISSLTEEEMLLIKEFFRLPGFIKTIDLHVEHFKNELASIDETLSPEELKLQFQIYKNAYMFWVSLKQSLVAVDTAISSTD